MLKHFSNAAGAAMLALGLTLSATSPAHSAEDAQVRFAAAPTGTTWYAYAGALRPALVSELPQGSNAEIMTTPMAIANTKLIGAQRADIALSFPPVASWATQAFGPFEREIDNMRGLVAAMDRYYQRVTVQKDSEIDSLAEIQEKQMAVNLGTGPQGSLNEYMARLVLESYGMSYKDIEDWGGSVTRTSLSVLRNQFGDGKLDMIIGITTEGHPNTAQLSITPGHRFLGLSPESVKYLGKYGFAPADLPANTFEGQTEAVNGVSFGTSLYAAADVSEEHAYLMTKGVMQKRGQIMKNFGSMKVWSAEGSADEDMLGVPLHPGAERYYREAGLLK